jgi:chromosome segregation ATPase
MATLVYTDSDGVDRSFALGSDPVTVGRGKECGIRSEDPRVSRVHARFFIDQGTLWVEDLGSQNGIYVGPNKVSRAPVPTGEIILIGSLMIRLLPASGTLPPPNGVHGQLASWLEMERKARAGVEEERDAFAQRVGELHEQLASKMDVEAFRLRDEAEARAAALESALGAVQDELAVLRQAVSATPEAVDVVRLRSDLIEAQRRSRSLEAELAERSEFSSVVDNEQANVLRELAKVKSELEETEAARKHAERAHEELYNEATAIRDKLDTLRRSSQEELEKARIELGKAREIQALAETTAGMTSAEKFAELDREITRLRDENAELRHAVPTFDDSKVNALSDDLLTMTARLEKAEKDLAAAMIRAQGAERNVSHATQQAAKAEGKVTLLEQRATEAEARVAGLDEELAEAREKLASLAARVGEGEAPLQAAESRAAKLAGELAGATSQLETTRARVAELETAIASATETAKAAEQRIAKLEAEAAAQLAKLNAELEAELKKAQTEAKDRGAKLKDAETKIASMQARLDTLSVTENAMAVAKKDREEAAAKSADADRRVRDAESRADDAEKRAMAADTMAKAMAKDVAEALRRAADADMRTRATGRELAEVVKRAEAAEKQIAEGVETKREYERKATESGGKLESVQKELGTKLESLSRELAAERSTSLTLVDRKTQLERELAEARAAVPDAQHRAEEAERKVAELEVVIETLQERVDDLESSVAVEKTASASSLEDARIKIRSLETELERSAKARSELDAMAAKLEAAEAEREEAVAGRTTADGALTHAQQRIAELEAKRAEANDGDQSRLEDALAKLAAAEREIESLRNKVDGSDLANGRASALQRQLDEALTKLAYMERDLQSAKGKGDSPAVVAAEARIKELEAQLAEAEEENQALAGQRLEAAARISDLQREVEAAENVRSFAANTEREIARLERDLRDARSKATQMTLERDRLASELRDARNGGDTDTTNRRAPIVITPQFDAEVTRQADLSQYEAVISKAAEVEKRLAAFERENAALKQQLAEIAKQMRMAEDRADDPTRTGSQMPMAIAEHVSALEESIDSLRANMRAASDETAMMDATESVQVVAAAVSQAAEHVERARAVLRALAQTVGL